MLTAVKFNLLIAWAATGISQLASGDCCPQNPHRPSSLTAARIWHRHPAGGGSEPISAESPTPFAEKAAQDREWRVPVTPPCPRHRSISLLGAGSAPAANSDRSTLDVQQQSRGGTCKPHFQTKQRIQACQITPFHPSSLLLPADGELHPPSMQMGCFGVKPSMGRFLRAHPVLPESILLVRMNTRYHYPICFPS